jgi:queuine tRNA-ribosyltransferase
LGAMLMTEHNLWFYQQLMAGLRGAIAAGELAEFASDFRVRYRNGKATP